jgi:tetratricopeptide (TPR) repeat protein
MRPSKRARWIVAIVISGLALGIAGATVARKLRGAIPPMLPMPLHRVRALAEQGHWEQAEQAIDRALDWHPRDGETLLLAARIAAIREQVDRCLDLLAQVPASSPQWPEARLMLGQALVGAGRAGRAEQVFREILARTGDDNPHSLVYQQTARAELATLLHLEQRIDESVALVWAMFPDHSEKWRLLVNLARMVRRAPYPSLSIPTLKSYVSNDPNASELHRALARYNLILMAWQEAAAEARLALQDAPNDLEAIEILLEALIAEQQWDAVDGVLSQCAGEETRPILWRSRAQRFEAAGDTAQAEHCFRRSLELDPTDPTTHFQLARILLLHGKTEVAKQHQDRFRKLKVHQDEIETFLKSYPLSDSANWQPPTADQCASMSLHCEGLSRLPEARAWAEEARRLNPTHARAAAQCEKLGRVPFPVGLSTNSQSARPSGTR